MVKGLRRTINKQSDNFNKEKKILKTQVLELKNTITKLKYSIEGFKNRLD